MTKDAPSPESYDLAIIGTGMAGMSAAVLASSRGLRVAIAGLTGEILFSSGLLDFLAIHPLTAADRWKSPWAAVEQLVKDEPNHPYARVSMLQMRSAWEQMLNFLDRWGLPYHRNEEENFRIITSQGTIKTSYCIPITMSAGVMGLDRHLPCLVVDIAGLRGFSADQIVQSLRDVWPGLRALHVVFPETDGMKELYPEMTARAMENSQIRRQLADAVRPRIVDAQVVGMPAILGISDSTAVLQDMEERLGVPVFEIPGIPPSVPGIRLKETFERALPEMGVFAHFQHRVFRLQVGDAGFRLILGRMVPETEILARSVLLATGRFFGGGLVAERHRVRESLLDLPVVQPKDRSGWHRADFFDTRGHPIHRAGIDVDAAFRPIAPSGEAFHPGLYAAGSILAHQDWIRSKSGVGIAVCTAYAAVDRVMETLRLSETASSMHDG